MSSSRTFMPPRFNHETWVGAIDQLPAPRGRAVTPGLLQLLNPFFVLMILSNGSGLAVLGDQMVKARNPWPVVNGLNRENLPIYFEVTGRRYHYVFCFWQDRVEIRVFSIKDDGDWVHLSSMFPTTVDEVRRAFKTIVEDYKALPLTRTAAI